MKNSLDYFSVGGRYSVDIIKKFQETLKVPAVQLVQELEGYRLLSNRDQSIMIAPAFQWLAQLP